MDIDVYIGLTGLVAVALPVAGWFLTKRKQAIPGLAAAFVVLAISARNAGLAPIDLRGVYRHQPRYLFGGVMLALGLLIWTLTVNRFCEGKPRD